MTNFNKILEYYGKEENRRLAELLEITVEDLSKLSYTFEPNYDHEDVIYSMKFLEKSPPEILKKIKILDSDNSIVFHLWELDNQYDFDEQYEAIIENKNFLSKFYDDIGKLEELNYLFVEDKKLEKILKRQLFIGVIGTMETYLSEVFINSVIENQKYFRNFIESHPDIKKRKFELSDIYVEYEKLNETAKKIMVETIYHNLPAIKLMFSQTFKITFPDIKNIYPLVMKRHDLVHRNGRAKNGKELKIDRQEVEDLITEVTFFIAKVAEAIAAKSSGSS